ncbi:adhesive plaque matrix protein 2-like [Sycon ciliatum]|uniref:adhesive plaque matrix protein 2-like n=1 Tax=Sycon ciliatum TaxID=27933 RepID=UPI0031F5F6AC
MSSATLVGVFMALTCLVYSSNAGPPGRPSGIGPDQPDYRNTRCYPRCVYGFCDGGRCRCEPGYKGRTCSERIATVSCYGGCANGGTCRYGSCSCRPGFSGSSCQTCQPIELRGG